MKRLLLVAVSFFTLLFIANAQSADVIQQYIDQYKEIAINEEIRTGVPAAITLAQGIFESMAGKSELALASNNHFGIKCKENWTGGKVYHDDDARGECFRQYNSVEESFRDHSDFLSTRPHYAFLFDIDPTDYKAWAHGLKKAGYATNPSYAHALIKKIEENDLGQYTLIALQRSGNGQDVAMNKTDLPVIMNAIKTSIPSINQIQPGASVPEEILEEYAGYDNYPTGLFTINKTKVIFASAGTSLFALASNNNISLEKILSFNDIDGNIDIIKNDQLVYLEKKPKKSDKQDFHIVTPGETIEIIAQKEGVQLESLLEYNKMQKGLQPAPGEKVYLKPGKQAYYPKLLPRTTAKTPQA